MTFRSRGYPLRPWLIETWLIRISRLSHAPGTARYSPEPKSNVLSPRRINAALLTIAARRLDNSGPITNGVVSNAGQGIFATAVRVGSGMSSRRAMHKSPAVDLVADMIGSARRRQFVLGFRFEVAGIVTLVQLAGRFAADTVDHAATRDCRTFQDRVSPTLNVLIFGDVEEFGGAVLPALRQPAIPRKHRHIGNGIIRTAEPGVFRQPPVEHVHLPFHFHGEPVDRVFDLGGRIEIEMTEAAAQVWRAAHLPEQPGQAFSSGRRFGGQKGAELLGQVHQNRAGLEHTDGFRAA